MKIDRRAFLGASALGLLAGAVPRSLMGALPSSLAGALHARELIELRRNVGIFTRRGGTIGWLVNASGAVVVDSQFPDSAAECLAGLDARGVRAIDALINTHHHGDHTAGNGVFRDAARRIVAQRRVPELQRRAQAASGTDTPQTYADTTFDSEWQLAVGDETVRARHYGAAHTGGDCTIHFERANVVHMGDLVFNRAYPFIDRAGGASVAGWIACLEAVAAEHASDTIFIFGHSNPAFDITGDRADVTLQRDFLSAVLDAAQRAIADGRTREQATSLDRLPGFADHVALSERLTLGTAIGAAFDELSEAA
jgi:cyclase